MNKDDRIGVLFVCLGNICRSPLAEGAFTHLVDAQGLRERFLIDSAGTSSWHVGEPPDERAREAARLAGFEIHHQRARKITAEDFHDFHYLLAMDENNLLTLKERQPPGSRSEVELLLGFANTGLMEVPDPYYGGVEGFQQVLDLVGQGAKGLLEVIRREHLS